MMKDQDKTKEQLMNELAEMRQRVAQLQEADTEHKQTKETLRESEARYRSLIDDVIDTAEAGIFILDENFRVVWVNQALERFFGLRRDRIIDRDKRELIRERIKYTFEDPETFAEKVLATYDSNTYVESFECHVLPSDEREERWLEHWSRPIRSGLYTGGRVELYYDITERKRAEEELRESEERYHSLFEGVPVGINRTTPEGQVLDANPALVQMLGYPDRETLLEVNVTDLYVDREDRRRWQALIEREGVVRGFEVQLRRHDGTIIWVRSNARAVCDADGRVLYYEGSLEDITERKRVEETLRENEELLRATLESTADGILVIGESGKMVHANTRFAEMWRIPQPVLDSRDDDTLLAFVLDQLQDPEAFLTKVRYLYGSSEEDLDTLQFKDGRVFERFSRPLLQDGMVAGRVWSFRDITEHKRAEEELQRLYEQAQRDAKTKATLLDEVNHRVKNTLTSITGLLYVEQSYAEMTDQAAYEAIIQNLTNRVSGLATVHSLLSASEWTPLPLSDVAGQVIKSAAQMRPRDKQVFIDAPPSPARVTPDQAHNLAMIINELATNTVQHTLPGRNEAHISVRIALEDGVITFEYRDDGPGYPEDVLQLERHAVGFDLIQNLVRQGLQGELSLHNDEGAVAVIRFPAQA